jgi:transcriptional regulator with XRE-family HTH domain
VGPRNEPQVALGRAIRQLRTADELQLSQEELGLKADIHPTWISHIEAGRTNPAWGTVRRIADALDVSVSELADLAEQLEQSRRS